VTILVNTFEGLSDGTTLTTGNTGGGSGNAFDAIAGTFTASTADAMSGSVSCVTGGTAAQAYLRWNPTSSTSLSARGYFKLGALTAADERLIVFLSTAGTAIAYVVGNGAGKLRFGCTGSGSTWTAPNTYPTSTWLRIECGVTAGTTTGNGVANVGIYLGHDTAIYDSGSFSASNLNIGGGGVSMDQVRFGKTSGTLASTIRCDDLKVDNTTDALLGPSLLPSFTWAHTVAQG
jgi:hypothetical protein